MNSKVLVSRSLFKIGWRYLRFHPWQSILMVLGISMGVAVAVGIDIANTSASRAFDLSTDAIVGRATHYISGGSRGVDESLYVALRRAGVEIPTAPVVTDYVTSPDMAGTTLQLLGVDPFSEAPFRNYLGAAEEVPLDGLTVFLSQPGSVLLSETLAERYSLHPGDKFEIQYAGRNIQVLVAGLLQPADSLTRQAIDSMLLVDIATAQEISGRLGRLDRIDLIVPDGADETLETIENMMPDGVLVLPNEVRSGTVEQITAAFRLNLTALSLLALVVALFLIYNTMTFSVVQRRPLFGTLRSLGVTRLEVFLMVVSEALVVGFLGATLGILIGILMGRGAVGLVSQTINDLFFVTTVQDIPIPLVSLVKGFALGVLATVITAAFPAWEAASVPPRTALSRANLESKAQRIVHWLGIAGVLIILLGFGMLLVSNDSLFFSFMGTFAVIFGFAILTPTFTVWLMTAANKFTSRLWGLLGRMAPREVINSISRTSIAVAALMVAIAVTIGVSLMVTSFRFTVDTWMNQILHGDIYISVPGATVSQPLQAIDPEVIEILNQWEGVSRVDLLQNAVVDSPAGPVQISANNNPNDGMEQVYRAREYPPEEMWQAVEQGAVLVSEPLANRLDLPLHGGELALYTKDGIRNFPIAGIYYDYASSQGTAILSLENYRQLWGDDQVAAAALILDPGVDVNTTVEALKVRLAAVQSLLIRPNQVLRADALDVFDRTFAITSALQLMTTFVAFVGVLSAMMSLQLDKQRQLGILKAIGLTGRQLWRLITLETGLMGAVAGLLSMPTGYVLALILVFIINQRSFGWTLRMQVTPEPFLQAFLIALLAALLAGLYPAIRIIKRNTSEAIRFD
ncbi:MAG: FtsX-like permease family protein [Anaerolineales bacterium]|jgi:putative ABC transport system permease protein